MGSQGKPWSPLVPGHAVLRSGSSRGSVIVFETAQLFIAEWPLGKAVSSYSDAQLLNSMGMRQHLSGGRVDQESGEGWIAQDSSADSTLTLPALETTNPTHP